MIPLPHSDADIISRSSQRVAVPVITFFQLQLVPLLEFPDGSLEVVAHLSPRGLEGLAVFDLVGLFRGLLFLLVIDLAVEGDASNNEGRQPSTCE